MPIFCGGEMDIEVKNGNIEDAMRITNSSCDSALADFGSHEFTDSYIDSIFASLREEDLIEE